MNKVKNLLVENYIQKQQSPKPKVIQDFVTNQHITFIHNKSQLIPTIMCFLPLGCLKAITTIGAVITILISFALLGVTIYANVYKKKIIDQASEGTINTALVFAYIGSIVFLLLGVAGLYGSLKGGKGKKGNKCLLGLYSIGIILFFFVFFAGTLVFFLGPKAIFFDQCDAGGAQSLNYGLYNQSLIASKTFCKPSGCQCYVNKANEALQKALTAGGYTNFNTTNDKLPIKYQQCSQYNASIEEKNVLLLAALEEALGCGGWCDGDVPKFYKFTDINNCGTLDCLTSMPSCYQAFKDFMYTKGETLAVVCLFACLLCLLNMLVVCCICCHPTKSGKKRNFYTRMIDNEN